MPLSLRMFILFEFNALIFLKVLVRKLLYRCNHSTVLIHLSGRSLIQTISVEKNINKKLNIKHQNFW